MIPEGPELEGLALESHRAEARIIDQTAVTKVTEVFRNQHEGTLEADFVFPLPRDAVVSNLTMYVNGRPFNGEIMEAGRARAIYEATVRQMRDPALLEYMDSGLLRLRVYPIHAGSRQEVALEYAEALEANEGLVEYYYPLHTPGASVETLEDFTLTIDITAAAGIRNVYSPTHPVAVNRVDDRHVKVGFEGTEEELNRDFQLFYAMSDADFGASLLSCKPVDSDGYFLLLLSPPCDVEEERLVSKDVVFVLDVSGSMAGEKIKQAKAALQFCIASLLEGDRFKLITFNDSIGRLSGGLRAANSQGRQEAIAYLSKLEGAGGTDIKSALTEALTLEEREGRPVYVVFLTDGCPSVGETDINRILQSVEKANKTSARLFSFGVGYDVNTDLLDGLTRISNGVNQYVHPDEDIEVKVSSFFRKIGEPMLSGVALDFGEVGAYDVYPRDPGDIFRGSQLVVAGRYRKPGPATVRMSGEGSSGATSLYHPVAFSAAGGSNSFVEEIWAGRRIGHLLGELRLKGESDELKQAVIQLSEAYGIVTPYTSYLIEEPAEEGGAMYIDVVYYGAYDKLSSGEEAVKASEAYAKLVSMDKVQEDRALRVAAGRRFYSIGGTWTEADAKEGLEVITVKFGSAAYFAIVAAAPQLREVFALGEKLAFTVGDYCLAIDEEGLERADHRKVRRILEALKTP
jgi:Ca-activated chloride channel family protein